MTKKQKLKKVKSKKKNSQKTETNVQKEAKKKNFELKNRNDYSIKSDFIRLAAIMIVFAALMVCLYYYDKQSNVLAVAAEKLMDLF